MTSYTGDPATDEVVFAKRDYKGWWAAFVGCGQMEFTDGKRRITVKEPWQNDPHWIRDCWQQAKAQIDAEKEGQG